MYASSYYSSYLVCMSKVRYSLQAFKNTKDWHKINNYA